MLLVFVATPVKLILGRDEVTLVVDFAPSRSHTPSSCEVTANGVLVNILLWEVYLCIWLKITCHLNFKIPAILNFVFVYSVNSRQ